MIGIHHSGEKSKGKNEGNFIGKILDNLKMSPVFSNNYMNMNRNNNYNGYDLAYLTFDRNYPNNNNNYMNYNANNYLNDNYLDYTIDRNEIINKISFNNRNENFIIGEIYIN